MGDAVQNLIEEYTLVATGAKPSMWSLQLARLQHKANLETIEKLRGQLDRALAREEEQDGELAMMRLSLAAHTQLIDETTAALRAQRERFELIRRSVEAAAGEVGSAQRTFRTGEL